MKLGTIISNILFLTSCGNFVRSIPPIKAKALIKQKGLTNFVALGMTEDVIANSKPSNKNERFIHPQVFKMFQRAQYLLRNGENVVAQRLLLRCLELNPYDSHRFCN